MPPTDQSQLYLPRRKRILLYRAAILSAHSFPAKYHCSTTFLPKNARM
jgi:hypothetical protein